MKTDQRTESEPTTVEKQSWTERRVSGKIVSMGDRSVKLFHFGSSDETQELKTWCQFHWEATIRKAITTNNTLYYHDCCTCFSRRGFLRRSGHPMLRSCSVAKMPTLMEVQSHEEFYQWVRGRLQEKQRQGMDVVFPSINRFHINMETGQESEDNNEEQEEEEDREMVGKRYRQAVRERNEALEKVKKLAAENRVLLASSKDWMEKFMKTHTDSADDEAESGYFWTPTKPH